MSHLHETVVAMFRHRPELAAQVLAGPLGLSLPGHARADLGSPDVVELRPVAHRADSVVVLRDEANRAVWAVVIEVQLRRDGDKTWVWPEYLIDVRRRLRCPTVLLIVCLDPATARWAARPITLGGPGSLIVPLVLGPEAIPVVTDPARAAEAPELSVLSALTHVRDNGPFAVLDALSTALNHVGTAEAVDYAATVLAALPQTARRYLEELMATETFEYQSEFTRALEARGEARGELRGRVAILLRILATRGIEISEAARTRITECTDPDQLDTWADRALTGTDPDDLFT